MFDINMMICLIYQIRLPIVIGKPEWCLRAQKIINSLTIIILSILFPLARWATIEKHQDGFRTGYSCTTQLLELMEDFTNFYLMEIPFDCIYLDFAKAFDRVYPQRLLTQLYNIGIRGTLIHWIKAFLQ